MTLDAREQRNCAVHLTQTTRANNRHRRKEVGALTGSEPGSCRSTCRYWGKRRHNSLDNKSESCCHSSCDGQRTQPD